MSHDSSSEVSRPSGETKSQKQGGLPKSFYKLNPLQKDAPSDETVTAFWRAQKLVGQQDTTRGLLQSRPPHDSRAPFTTDKPVADFRKASEPPNQQKTTQEPTISGLVKWSKAPIKMGIPKAEQHRRGPEWSEAKKREELHGKETRSQKLQQIIHRLLQEESRGNDIERRLKEIDNEREELTMRQNRVDKEKALLKEQWRNHSEKSKKLRNEAQSNRRRIDEIEEQMKEFDNDGSSS